MNQPNPGKKELVSIVMPARNEEGNIPRCYEEITRVMEAAGCDYEVVVTDNASSDRTGELCEKICATDPRWRYIRFSRNFTADNSMSAGLHYSRGDAVIILFSDLQEPPELIPRFLEKWREGYEIVYGVHTRRHGESPIRSLWASFFYKFINLLSEIQLPEHVADFRLMDRKVVNTINRMGERNRYLRGMIVWTGFRQTGIPYERQARGSGKGTTSYLYLFSYAVRSICSFSIRPLRFFFLFGMGVALLTVLLAAYYLYLYFAHGTEAPGIPTVILLLLGNIALTSLGIGVLGEYIGSIYTESKKRPLWVVEKAVNIEIPEERRYGN